MRGVIHLRETPHPVLLPREKGLSYSFTFSLGGAARLVLIEFFAEASGQILDVLPCHAA